MTHEILTFKFTTQEQHDDTIMPSEVQISL